MSESPWVRFFPSDWLAGTRGMTASETGVYITLIALMYEREEPLVEDHARLARLCGSSPATFRKTLAVLVDDGKIVRVDDGLWNARVEKEALYRREKSSVARESANRRWSKKDNENKETGDATAMQSQCDSNANQKPDTRVSTSLRSVETTRVPAGGFDRFWSLYPNKVGKRDAEKAFGKAIERADLDTVMAGLDRYVSKTDDRPWCNPSTWLNQDRWEDVPASPVPQARGSPSREPTMADFYRQKLEARQHEHDGPTIEASDGAGEGSGNAAPYLLFADEGRRQS